MYVYVCVFVCCDMLLFIAFLRTVEQYFHKPMNVQYAKTTDTSIIGYIPIDSRPSPLLPLIDQPPVHRLLNR